MEIVCPHCGAGETYQLADGRRQCRDCRRKFTPGGRKRKLSAQLQQAMRKYFWEMQPAEEVANQLKLNRKTVQKMYGEFRQMMTTFNQQQRATRIAECNQGPNVTWSVEAFVKQGEYPMFYLVDCGGFVAMYLAEEYSHYVQTVQALDLPVLMVYRRNGEGMLLDPEGVYRRQLQGSDGGEKALACLEFMLSKMKSYRGVPGDRSVLYAEEMLFRFNCRDNDCAWESIATATEQAGGKSLN